MNKHSFYIFLVINIIIAACNLPSSVQPTATPLPPPPAAKTATSIPPTATNVPETPTPSETPTPPPTATETPVPPTPTLTNTPGPTATPTFNFPSVTVNQQAHCRYGPSKAYLHAADLYAGDTGTVRGRFQYSKWLYIKFDKLNYFCWVAPGVVDVVGDITKIKYTEVRLVGPSVLYRPPQNVSAVRDGGKVTVSWDQVKMTDDDDRGYFLELFICQDGAYIWWTFSYPDQFKTNYTVKDEAGCPAPSGGKLYAVEKHGYTTPVEIPWPAP